MMVNGTTNRRTARKQPDIGTSTIHRIIRHT